MGGGVAKGVAITQTSNSIQIPVVLEAKVPFEKRCVG